MGPPNGVVAPKPTSSISTIITFGAPSGASTLNNGGASTPRTSSSLNLGASGSAIGRCVRSTSKACAPTQAAITEADSPNLAAILNVFIISPILKSTENVFTVPSALTVQGGATHLFSKLKLYIRITCCTGFTYLTAMKCAQKAFCLSPFAY